MFDYKLHIFSLIALVMGAAACSPAFGAEPDSMLLLNGWVFRPATDRDERLIADAPEDLRIAAPDNADEWFSIAVPGAWTSQRFNPSRAGWYRCVVELPESWKGRILALDLTARCRNEVVFCNGEPIGASRKRPEMNTETVRNVYLLPGRITRSGSVVLAVRLDAAEIPAPGLVAPPVLRPAALHEYMAPQTDSEGRFLHCPQGADFFPRDPFELSGILINIGSPSFGCIYEHGQEAHAQILAVPFDSRSAVEFVSVAVNYSISNNVTGTEVVSGAFVLQVPATGAVKDMELFAGEPGTYTARFLFSSGGISKVTQLRYSVVPEPPDGAPVNSPFGLVLTAPAEITRLSGAPWIMRPGVLTTDFLWQTSEAMTDQVVQRLKENARTGNYNCILNSDANAGADVSPIQNFSLPEGDAAAIAEKVRRAYLQQKADNGSIFQLVVSPGRNTELAELAAAGVFEFCDILCVTYSLPVGYVPEHFVQEKMRTIRQAIAGPAGANGPVRAARPPAIALSFTSNAPVPPRMVVRTCLQAIASGAWKVYWDANGYGASGWLQPNHVPGPQFTAFAAMNNLLREAYYVGTLNFGEDVHAMAFFNGLQNVLVVWRQGDQAFVKLPPAERVLDVTGRQVLEHNSGLTEVMLSDKPVYLAGVSDADLAGIMPADTVIPSQEDVKQHFAELAETDPAAGFSVDAGDRPLFFGSNSLRLTIENWFGTAFSGNARLILPQQWNAEPLQQEIQFSAGGKRPSRTTAAFDFAVPDVPPGYYPLRLEIIDQDEMLTAFDVTAEVTTPLGDFSGIELTEAYTATPSMAVPVTNVLDEPITARVGLEIANWTVTPRFVPVTLAPGERKLLQFLVFGRLPVVGPLPVSVQVESGDARQTIRRTANISQQRIHGWAVGEPEVQALRFDGQTISYRLSKMAVVSVRVYAPDGTLLEVLDAGWQMAGPHNYAWTPERRLDSEGQRIKYVAEVRAGMDLACERQLAAPPEAVFSPYSIEVLDDEAVVFDGRRALKFDLLDELLQVDLPLLRLENVRDIKPLPTGSYAVLRGNQLLLTDKKGKILKAVPDDPRSDGDIALGHFRSPIELAVGGEGEIFVADAGNNRIQRFDTDLEPLPFTSTSALGRKGPYGCPLAGTADGEFSQPRHVLYNQKRLFVLDTTGRLQIFDQAGRHQQTIQTMLKDVACITAHNDAIYASRWNSGRVTRFSLRNGMIEAESGFGNEGTIATGARQVQSLGLDRRGRLLACTSYPDEIAAFDAETGRRLTSIGRTPHDDMPELPAGLDVDQAGGLVYTDLAKQSVVRLNSSGSVLWSVPGQQLPATLNRPIDAALDRAGNVYVLDRTSGGGRLIALDDHGAPRFLFNGSYLLEDKAFETADNLIITDSGFIWVGSGQHGILLNMTGGVISRDLARPTSRAHAGGLQFVPCSQENACALKILDMEDREIASKGVAGTGAGEFAGCLPGGIAACSGGQGEADYVFFADVFNHRITVMRVRWSTFSQVYTD